MENSEDSSVIQSYIKEISILTENLKNHSDDSKRNLDFIYKTKNVSKILGFEPIYKLQKALCDLYISVQDKKLPFTENLSLLVRLTAEKIDECCTLVSLQTKDALEDLEDIDIKLYLLYLDKATAGEIFDPKFLTAKKTEIEVKKRYESKSRIKDELVQIHSSELAKMVTLHEEIIARTYIISNQLELLKNAIEEGDVHLLKDTYKLLLNDTQNIQNSLLLVHDNMLSLIHDDSFLESHQDCQGFFVMANGKKYLIPSKYVEDVICESELNYEVRQNQKFYIHIQESETGSSEEREEIPVYSLSSLFPGQSERSSTNLDTILIVNYQSQKIGIIVDSMQKFVSLIKKPMPQSFVNFPILQGLAFDEKYDMIPILHIPEIMRKFRALRGYDVKKFEAKNKKHIYRILIVEDSETTRQIEHSILASNGFFVEDAVDGIDAMEKVKEIQFDMILSDDSMPRMNGSILLDNLRRMENYEDVPFISLSENPIEGADSFISKSDFKRDNLIQVVKEMLR